MKILVLDVETLTDRYVPPEGEEPKFPNISFHDPLVVTWMKVNTDKAVVAFEEHRQRWSDECDEPASDTTWLSDALSKLRTDLMNADRLVTYNGRCFDMPLLQLWAWRLGIEWSFWQNKNDRYPRYNKPLFHWDIMDRATDAGAAKFVTLDQLCKFFGLPGKPADIDGAKVCRELWKLEPLKIIDYCLDDVIQTWLCAARVMNRPPLTERILSHVGDRLVHPREAYGVTS